MRIFILSVVFAVFACPLAFGHSPAHVEITPLDNKIEVIVTHPVGNPNDHYVNKIEVFINGEKVTEKEYTSQVGNLQIGVFDIKTKKDDKIEVIAYCNRGGSRKGVLTVE